MEDVEHIEVIRGPAATLWGANAVNRVINIITKRAEDTQGGLTEGFGNEEQGFGGVRYGGGANAYYRVYGKHFSRSESVDSLVLVNPDRGISSWVMTWTEARLHLGEAVTG